MSINKELVNDLRKAQERIAELKAENEDLLAACEQKQEIINSLPEVRD